MSRMNGKKTHTHTHTLRNNFRHTNGGDGNRDGGPRTRMGTGTRKKMINRDGDGDRNQKGEEAGGH